MANLRLQFYDSLGVLQDLSVDQSSATSSEDVYTGSPGLTVLRAHPFGSDATTQNLLNLISDLIYNDIQINAETNIAVDLMSNGVLPSAIGVTVEEFVISNQGTDDFDIGEGKAKVGTGVVSITSPSLNVTVSSIATQGYYRRDFVELEILPVLQINLIAGTEGASIDPIHTQLDANQSGKTSYILYSVLSQNIGGTTTILSIDQVWQYIGFEKIIGFKHTPLSESLERSGLYEFRHYDNTHLIDDDGVYLGFTYGQGQGVEVSGPNYTTLNLIDNSQLPQSFQAANTASLYNYPFILDTISRSFIGQTNVTSDKVKIGIKGDAEFYGNEDIDMQIVAPRAFVFNSGADFETAHSASTLTNLRCDDVDFTSQFDTLDARLGSAAIGSTPTTFVGANTDSTALTGTDYTLDVKIDTTTYQLASMDLSTTGNDDWDAVAAVIQTTLRTATSGTETVIVTGGEIIITSDSTNLPVTISAGTASGTELLAAIDGIATYTTFLDHDVTGGISTTTDSEDFIVIVGGYGKYQTAKITAFDATNLTISGLTIPPNETSQFKVFRNGTEQIIPNGDAAVTHNEIVNQVLGATSADKFGSLSEYVKLQFDFGSSFDINLNKWYFIRLRTSLAAGNLVFGVIPYVTIDSPDDIGSQRNGYYTVYYSTATGSYPQSYLLLEDEFGDIETSFTERTVAPYLLPSNFKIIARPLDGDVTDTDRVVLPTEEDEVYIDVHVGRVGFKSGFNPPYLYATYNVRNKLNGETSTDQIVHQLDEGDEIYSTFDQLSDIDRRFSYKAQFTGQMEIAGIRSNSTYDYRGPIVISGDKAILVDTDNFNFSGIDNNYWGFLSNHYYDKITDVSRTEITLRNLILQDTESLILNGIVNSDAEDLKLFQPFIRIDDKQLHNYGTNIIDTNAYDFIAKEFNNSLGTNIEDADVYDSTVVSGDYNGDIVDVNMKTTGTNDIIVDVIQSSDLANYQKVQKIHQDYQKNRHSIKKVDKKMQYKQNNSGTDTYPGILLESEYGSKNVIDFEPRTTANNTTIFPYVTSADHQYDTYEVENSGFTVSMATIVQSSNDVYDFDLAAVGDYTVFLIQPLETSGSYIINRAYMQLIKNNKVTDPVDYEDNDNILDVDNPTTTYISDASEQVDRVPETGLPRNDLLYSAKIVPISDTDFFIFMTKAYGSIKLLKYERYTISNGVISLVPTTTSILEEFTTQSGNHPEGIEFTEGEFDVVFKDNQFHIVYIRIVTPSTTWSTVLDVWNFTDDTANNTYTMTRALRKELISNKASQINIEINNFDYLYITYLDTSNNCKYVAYDTGGNEIQSTVTIDTGVDYYASRVLEDANKIAFITNVVATDDLNFKINDIPSGSSDYATTLSNANYDGNRGIAINKITNGMYYLTCGRTTATMISYPFFTNGHILYNEAAEFGGSRRMKVREQEDHMLTFFYNAETVDTYVEGLYQIYSFKSWINTWQDTEGDGDAGNGSRSLTGIADQSDFNTAYNYWRNGNGSVIVNDSTLAVSDIDDNPATDFKIHFYNISSGHTLIETLDNNAVQVGGKLVMRDEARMFTLFTSKLVAPSTDLYIYAVDTSSMPSAGAANITATPYVIADDGGGTDQFDFNNGGNDFSWFDEPFMSSSTTLCMPLLGDNATNNVIELRFLDVSGDDTALTTLNGEQSNVHTFTTTTGETISGGAVTKLKDDMFVLAYYGPQSQQAAYANGTINLLAGYDWSVGTGEEQDFVIDDGYGFTGGPVTVTLDSDTTTLTEAVTEINAGIDAAIPPVVQEEEFDCVPDSSGSLNNKYFWLFTQTKSYYVWYNVSAGGTDPNPAAPSSSPKITQGIEVAITTDDGDTVVAGLTQSDIDNESDFSASVLSTTVTVTHASTGYVKTVMDDVTNGAGILTITVNTPGAGKIIEAYEATTNTIGFRSTTKGTYVSFTIAAGTINPDALATLGISPGTYSGNDNNDIKYYYMDFSSLDFTGAISSSTFDSYTFLMNEEGQPNNNLVLSDMNTPTAHMKMLGLNEYNFIIDVDFVSESGDTDAEGHRLMFLDIYNYITGSKIKPIDMVSNIKYGESSDDIPSSSINIADNYTLMHSYKFREISKELSEVKLDLYDVQYPASAKLLNNIEGIDTHSVRATLPTGAIYFDYNDMITGVNDSNYYVMSSSFKTYSWLAGVPEGLRVLTTDFSVPKSTIDRNYFTETTPQSTYGGGAAQEYIDYYTAIKTAGFFNSNTYIEPKVIYESTFFDFDNSATPLVNVQPENYEVSMEQVDNTTFIAVYHPYDFKANNKVFWQKYVLTNNDLTTSGSLETLYDYSAQTLATVYLHTEKLSDGNILIMHKNLTDGNFKYEVRDSDYASVTAEANIGLDEIEINEIQKTLRYDNDTILMLLKKNDIDAESVVLNGTFNTDTYWELESGAVAPYGWEFKNASLSGRFDLTTAALGGSQRDMVAQKDVFTVGKKYKIFYKLERSAGNLYFGSGDYDVDINYNYSAALTESTTTNSVTITAIDTDFIIRADVSATTGFIGTLRDVVIFELINGVYEITDVTCLQQSGNLSGSEYFWLFTANTSYFAWYDLDNGSSAPTPTPPGGAPTNAIGIEIDIATGDSADDVATKTQVAIDDETDFIATVSTSTVTIMHTSKANVMDSIDEDTGFTINVTTQGINDASAGFFKTVIFKPSTAQILYNGVFIDEPDDLSYFNLKDVSTTTEINEITVGNDVAHNVATTASFVPMVALEGATYGINIILDTVYVAGGVVYETMWQEIGASSFAGTTPQWDVANSGNPATITTGTIFKITPYNNANWSDFASTANGTQTLNLDGNASNQYIYYYNEKAFTFAFKGTNNTMILANDSGNYSVYRNSIAHKNLVVTSAGVVGPAGGKPLIDQTISDQTKPVVDSTGNFAINYKNKDNEMKYWQFGIDGNVGSTIKFAPYNFLMPTETNAQGLHDDEMVPKITEETIDSLQSIIENMVLDGGTY